MYVDIFNNIFSHLNKQKYVQSENLKSRRRFEDAHQKIGIQVLPGKCHLWAIVNDRKVSIIVTKSYILVVQWFLNPCL